MRLNPDKVGIVRRRLRAVAKVLGVWLATPLARKLVYALFLVQAVYLVFMIPIGVPPDELAHIRVAEQYVQQGHLSPVIDEQTDYSLGDITRNTDYFYHYVLSLVARLMPFDGLPLYVVFRFMSVGIMLLTLLAGARLMKQLKVNEAVTTVGLLVVSNIAQILFMSAAINQDQIVWLATIAGALFLVRLWQKMNLIDVLILVNIVMFASISKKTFLPIAVLFGAILLILVWQQRRRFIAAIKQSVTHWRPAVIVLGLLAVVGIGLNIERFGYNLVTYQQISVSCNKIHTHDQCMEHGVYRRNANLTDRRPADFIPVPINEFASYWYPRNFQGVFGTQGWTGRALPDLWAYNTLLGMMTASFVLGIIYSVRRWRRPESIIFVASLGYIALQMMVNYNVYLTYAAQGLALQGRYIFPIFVPLILVLAYMWYRILKRWPVALMALSAAVVVMILTQNGLSVIVRSGLYTDTPLQPVVLFDPENAISEFEPGI